MFSASVRFVAKIVDAMPNEKLSCFFAQRLHRLDRLRRLVEALLDRAHLVVDVADAVERDADADQDAVRGAELDDAREHRDRALRRQAGRVDADLAHPRQMTMEHLHHLGEIVPGGRLAAGDVEVFDRTPERIGEHRLELLERHVRLAIAPLPVAAHRAARIADPGAVIDEDGRPNGVNLRADERIDQIAGHACRGSSEVSAGER